jgi:mannitol-1-phosphate/altronate dehydrogenase
MGMQAYHDRQFELAIKFLTEAGYVARRSEGNTRSRPTLANAMWIRAKDRKQIAAVLKPYLIRKKTKTKLGASIGSC